ncbi:phosphatidylinositol N-acetylglucosaminyltransferase [Ascodesmis nigricans]|uniref:Phosphatidylinositol N-acetylglucosaminyltransferase n=1 Tax=Ascodesmis nigricans TaxID=341454 RepID=A0A4S2N2R6_9PEZI|nr:phosphatidylinositol N-acetylglucosaminyltransferase [Ascodesmis nigricans]
MKKKWAKLLWVEQDYPDNWVDPTFLKDLQRNINVRPYDFYSLVAESTVIVQHVSSVVIFVTSFIAIFTECVSPVSVVGSSTLATIGGWATWEWGWKMREVAEAKAAEAANASFGNIPEQEAVMDRDNSGRESAGSSSGGNGVGRGLGLEFTATTTAHEQRTSVSSSFMASEAANAPASGQVKDYSKALRRARIMTTAKSALLIYFTLLGLSPILRSLTSSISKDSIWAIATWLFIANVLGFDYGSGVEQKYPASFSTNTAIAAAVVLASTLPSTTHVFSLMLFSIQVFGLFPVFRRFVKHASWPLHVGLTIALVLGAGVGLGTMVGWGWAIMWVLSVVTGMVGCAWWMIDLQKYKNEIHGPWDPARPVVRHQWE